jgi:hypothetical protein
MLEEVLHLVAHNGFAKDIGPAVATCKAIMTDERIWFPHLIQQTYGPKQKTRLQILAEHMTQLKEGHNIHLIPKKKGPMIYRPEERWLARLDELDAMGKLAGHPEILKTMLSTPDSVGMRVMSVACENNCPKIVTELIKRGVPFNRIDDTGASPCYYAFNSKFGRAAFSALPWHAKYSYPKPKEPSWQLDNLVQLVNIQPNPVFQHDLIINGQAIEVIYNSAPPPKPKRLKSKLYKQQFGAKR